MDDYSAYWIDENGEVRSACISPPKKPHQDCKCLECQMVEAEIEIYEIRQEKDGSWSQRL